MKATHRVGWLALTGVLGAILTASCVAPSADDDSASTRGAGSNATDDARGSCEAGDVFDVTFHELVERTPDFWGEASFDADTGTLFFLGDIGGSRGDRRVVYRCDVTRDEPSCTGIAIEDAQWLIGAGRGRFAVIARAEQSTQSELVRCTYDGQCTRTDAFGAVGGTHDVAAGTVILYADRPQPDGVTPGNAFIVCPMDGGDCEAPWFQGFTVSAIVDSAVDPFSGNQMIATRDTAQIRECAASDGTWCAGYAGIFEGDVAGSGQLLFDESFVYQLRTDDGSAEHALVLFRCTRGSERRCTHQTLALGAGQHLIEGFSAAIDVENDRLLVVINDSMRDAKPSLLSCARDGTSCVDFDISAGTTVSAGDPRAFIDGARDRLLALTEGGLFDVAFCSEEPTPPGDASPGDSGSSANDAGSGSSDGASSDGGGSDEGGGKTW